MPAARLCRGAPAFGPYVAADVTRSHRARGKSDRGTAGAITSGELAAAPDSHSGVASGINNAVARAGSLLAVAALPALVGLSGSDYEQAGPMTSGYRLAMLICAGLLALGGIISWVGLRSSRP